MRHWWHIPTQNLPEYTRPFLHSSQTIAFLKSKCKCIKDVHKQRLKRQNVVVLFAVGWIREAF